MVTKVSIAYGGTGESTQSGAQAALGLHSSNSVTFSSVTVGSTNVLANDYSTYLSALANDHTTYSALKITIQDDTSNVYTAPSILNFGSGLIASNVGSVVTITSSGGGGGGGLSEKSYNFVGPISTGLGIARWYPSVNMTLTGAYLIAGVPPDTGNLSVNINVNGSSVGTVILTSGQYKSSLVTLNNSVATTSYVTVDVNYANNAMDASLIITYST